MTGSSRPDVDKALAFLRDKGHKVGIFTLCTDGVLRVPVGFHFLKFDEVIEKASAEGYVLTNE